MSGTLAQRDALGIRAESRVFRARCVKNTNALKTYAPGRSGMILPGVRTAGLMGGGARHGRGTAAEGETGLDFAGEKSAC